MATSKNQEGSEQTEIAQFEVGAKGSPVFGWSASLVERALQQQTKAHNQAVSIDSYPLTLKDIKGFYLDNVIYKLLKVMPISSVMWIGKSGCGKTPAMCTLSMLWSTYRTNASADPSVQAVKPSFRTAKYFDAFRGEDGTETRPCQFDDGRLAAQPPEKLKSFLAVTEEDGGIYERWGFAKFDRGCIRQVGSNPFDEKFEEALGSKPSVARRVRPAACSIMA